MEECTETACIEGVMVEVGSMEGLVCMVGECTMVVLEALWVVMGWAWGVHHMEIRILIIRLALRHLLRGFGYPSCGWYVKFNLFVVLPFGIPKRYSHTKERCWQLDMD